MKETYMSTNTFKYCNAAREIIDTIDFYGFTTDKFVDPFILRIAIESIIKKHLETYEPPIDEVPF